MQSKKDDSKAHKNDGARLAIVRKILNFNQRQMACLFGYSEKTQRHYEHAITETPLYVRRRVHELSGLDIHPLDPEEAPYLMSVQNRKPTTEEAQPPLPDPGLVQHTLLRCIKHFRNTELKRQKNELTATRRLFESTLNSVYLTAALVFAVEQFQRSIGGWHSHHAFHDLLHLGSFLTVLLLLLPVLMTVPWSKKST